MPTLNLATHLPNLATNLPVLATHPHTQPPISLNLAAHLPVLFSFGPLTHDRRMKRHVSYYQDVAKKLQQLENLPVVQFLSSASASSNPRTDYHFLEDVKHRVRGLKEVRIFLQAYDSLTTNFWVKSTIILNVLAKKIFFTCSK